MTFVELADELLDVSPREQRIWPSISDVEWFGGIDDMR